MPDPHYYTFYEKDNTRRSSRKTLASEYPDLKYVSGTWGKGENLYKYKDESGKEYGYKMVFNPDGTSELVSTGPLSKPAPKVVTAPKINATVEKKPVVINPMVNEQPRKPIVFGTSGYTDPNTGQTYSYDASYKQKEIEPNVQNYKKGGIVGKVKGYMDGGDVDLANAGIGVGTNLMNMGAGYMMSNAENEDGTVDVKKAQTAGGLKGASTGLKMGATIGLNPAALAATGGLSALAVPAAALIGGGIGLATSKKTAEKQNEEITAANKKAEDEKAAAERQQMWQLAMNKQMQERQAGYKDGGKIVGPGGPKSDSILAKVKPGSFVVPAENADTAEAIRAQVLKDGGKIKKAPSVKKKANLDQEDGELVKLSNGEHLFSPEERKKIIYELGEDVLEMLAPNAEENESENGEKEEEYAKGGLTSAKAKTILRDGTVRGKALTAKQKRFFGAIAGGQSVKEYMCGGKVKGYAEGGTTGDDEELKRIAKREAELKAKEEADKKKLEQQKQVAEKKAGAYEKTMTLLELRNEKKSELEQKLAKLERELKSKEKAYETYKKQQDALRDRKTTGGVRAQTNLYNEKERLAKEKELATEIKKYRDELETSAKQYSVISDDKNFNPDGTIKAKGKDPEVDKIFTTTGDKIMAADNADALSKAKGDSVKKMLTAPKIGQTKQGGTGASTKLAQSVKFKAPMGEASDTEVPVNNVPVAQTPEEKSLVESAKKQEELMAAQTGKDKTKPDYLKAGLTAAQGLSGLANYILPYKQYALGRKFLAEAGARPEDKIDPDFLNAVSDAQVSAKYGYTPEEQALLNQQNISALRSGEGAAKLYSGGSASNAYNLQRQAANDYFTRGLQQAVQNKQLQMSKQQYANDLVANKAEMSRRLFQDTMNAWQQKQQSGAALVGAGLQNLIGAKRLNDEMAFNRDYAQGENAWYKTIGQ